MKHSCLKIIVLFVLILCMARAQGGIGARIFGGVTWVDSSGSGPTQSTNAFFGAGLFLGNSKFEFAFSWYIIPLQNSYSNQYMAEFVFRPLELGNVRCGLGMGIGYTDATVTNQGLSQDYQGVFYQPKLSVDIPLSCSDEKVCHNGVWYPCTIFSMDIDVGDRISNPTLQSPNFYPNGPPQINLSGFFISIGMTLFINPH
jgi:hypothetical protein